MGKKGKKKSQAQAAAASTSSIDPTPSTSGQQSSQQKQQQQSSQQQRQPQPAQQQQPSQQQQRQPQPQQQQQRQPQPQQQQQRQPQPQQQQQQRPPQQQQQQQRPPQQQQRPPQQQQQQQRPPPQQQQQQRPPQQQQQQQRPPQQQQQQQRPPQQQQQQQRPPQEQQQQQRPPQPQQQQQRPPQQQPFSIQQELLQPRAWGPPRMQQPAPPPQQISQPQAWVSVPPQQLSTQQQVSGPHLQQFIPHQPPSSQVPPQAWGRFPLQPRQQRPMQQRYVQPSWVQPLPQVSQQQGLVQQQFVSSQEPQTWSVSPQQPVQQSAQQTTLVSYPSTSSQQVLDTGDLQQMSNVQSKDKVTEKGDTSGTTTFASSTGELSKELSQLSTWETKHKRMCEKGLNIPRRQNPYKAGTVGTRIRVLTNMFEIIFKKDFVTTAVHYDVKVVPLDNVTTQKKKNESSPKKGESKTKRELKNKILLRKIFEKWRAEHFPNRYPAFDGMANAFAAHEFPFEDTWVGPVNVHDDERDEDRNFEISINKAGIVDLSWLKTMKPGLAETEINQTAIQVLDIILRHAPASRLISVGRSLFPPGSGGRVKVLGNGLDLHVGGFTSAVIGWKPYLNIDVSHKAFVTPENVVDIICDIVNAKKEDIENILLREMKRYEDKISKTLSGVKVNYAIPGQPSTKRTHRINGLGPDAVGHTFEVKGKICSTEEYFATCKNYKLMYPRLPCLWVGKRDGKTYLPAELCKVVPGQATNKKLDESQTTQMIKFAATDTDTRINKIRKAFNGINLNRSDVVQNEFHLEVSAQMKEVDARILPPPVLQYNEQVFVKKGVWRAKRFSKPAKLEDGSWTIANVCRENVDNKLPDFVDRLKNQANYLGMSVGKARLPYLKVNSTPREIEKFLCTYKNLKLIIVILPDRTDAVYGMVKKISELRVGVLTQCIKIKNVIYLNNSTIQNILLKINSKLNGINHTFTQSAMPFCLREKKYMLIGADVSHPSPDAKDIPSVAAVAASHDETTFKYNVTIRLQQPKQEEIADLKEIMIKHIEFYVKEMKMVPQIIIFYRDGVSEGQIGMVLHKEIKSIKDACREYARQRPEFDPKLTFVIVQKRHHVRIFPVNKEETDDRNCNVKAGTIVDTEITHPSHIDFYLVSHASIQGTARPTKYRCICNESNFNENQLEELTYHLCHMYARCTRSVSYPAPTYYAHLAAYRGRMWIQGDRYTETDFQDKDKCKLEPVLKMPMSFI